MKLTIETDYALRIMLYMYNQSKIISGTEIVTQCKIPERMGLKILSKLVGHKLLKSIKGIKGGFLFPDEKLMISILDIIKVFESLQINRCLINVNECDYLRGNCAMCEELRKINNDMLEKFSKLLLKDIWQKQQLK